MSDWDRLLAVNLRGAVLCARQAFRLMQERGGASLFGVYKGSIFVVDEQSRSNKKFNLNPEYWNL